MLMELAVDPRRDSYLGRCGMEVSFCENESWDRDDVDRGDLKLSTDFRGCGEVISKGRPSAPGNAWGS